MRALARAKPFGTPRPVTSFVASAATGPIIRSILRFVAAVRRPGLDQRSIDAKMLVAEQSGDLRLGNDRVEQVSGDTAPNNRSRFLTLRSSWIQLQHVTEVWVVVADSILESATYRISMRWFRHGRSVRRLDGVSGADPRRQSPVERPYSLCTGFHEQSRRLRCRGLIRAGAVKNNLAIGRPLLSVPGNVLQRYV